MQRFRSRWAAKGVLLAAAALATAAGASGATTTRGASRSSSASATLVVDRSFEILEVALDLLVPEQIVGAMTPPDRELERDLVLEHERERGEAEARLVLGQRYGR